MRTPINLVITGGLGEVAEFAPQFAESPREPVRFMGRDFMFRSRVQERSLETWTDRLEVQEVIHLTPPSSKAHALRIIELIAEDMQRASDNYARRQGRRIADALAVLMEDG